MEEQRLIRRTRVLLVLFAVVLLVFISTLYQLQIVDCLLYTSPLFGAVHITFTQNQGKE